MTGTNKTQIYIIHSFMRDMGLKKSELLIYAILYAFTTGEIGLFYGSQNHLAYLSGLSLRTVQRALSSLFKKGYIARTEKTNCKGIECKNEKKSELSVSSAVITEHAYQKIDAKSEISEENPREKKQPASPIEKIQLSIKKEEKSAPMNELTEAQDSSKKTRLPSITNSFRNYVGNSNRSVGRAVKYDVKGYGRYGFVCMTEAQHTSLLSLVDSEVLTSYVRRLEMMLENNTNTSPPPPHSAYKTLKKWIEADFGL